MIDLAGLVQDPNRVAEVPPDQVPLLLGDLERLRATLWARLMAPAGNGHAAAPEEDRWFTIPEVAERLRLARA